MTTRNRSYEEFRRTHPRIAGGAPPSTLKDALADLDAELETLNKNLSAGGGDDPAAGDGDAEAAADTGGGAATATKDADTEAAERKAALDAREKELASQEERVSGALSQVTALIKTLNQHGGSRFAGAGVSPEVAKALAEGGSVELGGGLVSPAAGGQVKVGTDRELKMMQESKSFARFFSTIKAVQEGYCTDTEKRWMMHQKALAEQTGSAGGFLIPPDWMPDILKLFRGVTVIRRARPGIIQPFTAQMNQVGLTGGATAFYTPENAAIPTSQPALNQTTLLTPKNLTGLVPASNWLLLDSRRTDVDNPLDVDAEQVIRQDLAVVMALKEDKNFLFGNPGSETGSPTGIANIAGIVSNPIAPGTNGFQPTLPQLRFIKNYPRRFSIPNARWTWFFHSEFLSYIEGLTDSLGRFLADAPNLLTVNDDDNAGSDIDAAASGSLVGAGAGFSGRLLNIPFFCSNQIPVNLTQGSASNASWALLVDMNQLVVGLNRDLVIEASSEAAYTPDGGTTWISSFQNNQTLFKATLRHDINHRYPNIGVIQQNGLLVS